MTDREIYDLLKQTGHLDNPFGKSEALSTVDSILGLFHVPAVERAIASYQDFNGLALEPLAMKHHGRPVRPNTGMGPATEELFKMSRCGCPDYDGKPQRKIGTGSWKSCHKIGSYHAATVYIDERNMPSFLKPHFDVIWERTVAAFEAIGLRFIRVNKKDGANVYFSFDTGRRNWIGLAIVGSGQSCTDQIWCKYAASYQPSDIIAFWTELLMHELGHNCGLRHTRGGIMNAVLMAGLAPTWRGDSSEPLLNQWFGGVPIPRDDSGPPSTLPVGNYYGRLFGPEELDCSVTVPGSNGAPFNCDLTVRTTSQV